MACISVGALYHCFPSKEALLVSMARRELEAHQVVVRKALAKLRPELPRNRNATSLAPAAGF
jgi:AcrR family transcriptional regulator